MLIDKHKIKKIIEGNTEHSFSLFSKRNDDFLAYFKILIEVLSEVGNSQTIDPWRLYKTFQKSQSFLTSEELDCLKEDIMKTHKLFGNLSLQEIELNIWKSLDCGDVQGLITCHGELESYLLGLDLFPDKIIEIITNLLTNKDFLFAEGSWHILNILLNESEIISSEQWNNLLPYIEKSYCKFKDWMSCFILTEIIGDKFPTRESFNTLMELKKTKDELRRSFIPNALEGFVRYSHDQELRKEAYENIIDMLSDSSNVVVKESLRSCKFLKNIVIQLGLLAI